MQNNFVISEGWRSAESDRNALGRALPKGRADSGGEMMNGARPLESHPTSLRAVGASPDVPSELAGRQSMILILIGARQQGPKPMARKSAWTHPCPLLVTGLISDILDNSAVGET